jgi:pyruvate dehydrogenase E2 component (dihydrolipoyllysine-residue acetyltransferase)
MPKLGFSMEQGTVVQWLKGAGDRVERGEPVVLIHSEKVEYEVEAQGSGKLLRILAEPSAECPPGHLLGIIAEDGEDIEAFLRNYQAEAAWEEDGAPAIAGGLTTAAPDRSQVGEVRASPRARKLAAEKNVDLATLAAESSGKRIGEDDVLRFLERQAIGSSGASRVLKRIPLAGMRGEIASRMLASWQSSAAVGLSMRVDFFKAERLRQSEQRISYQDIVMRATALELRADPRLNSAIRDGHIEIYEPVNIGFAVSLDDGLVVPIIHDADRKSLADISTQRAALVEAAHKGQLKLDQVQGCTFTLSSLGSYGVTVFTPILNPPQAGILGVGAVEHLPAAVEGMIEVRPTLTLTLVFDHRVIDGAPAAAFLKAIRDRLERFELD